MASTALPCHLRAWFFAKTSKIIRQLQSDRAWSHPGPVERPPIASDFARHQSILISQIADDEIDVRISDREPCRGIECHVVSQLGVRRLEQIVAEGTDIGRVDTYGGLIVPILK